MGLRDKFEAWASAADWDAGTEDCWIVWQAAYAIGVKDGMNAQIAALEIERQKFWEILANMRPAPRK